MIKTISGYEYAEIFALIYNSSNTLFPLNERCDADEKIFYEQLAEDTNFVYTDDSGICGFVSYHKSKEYYEITSLYVKRDYQRMGIGHSLLSYVENQIPSRQYTIIKVLNNAYWAMDFYQKNGYTFLHNNQFLVKKWNITENPWEKILYKLSS